MSTTGTDNCGSCTLTFNNVCDAPTPSCGQTTTGNWTCGGTCTRTGSECTSWVPYGYAYPGDPTYGFGFPDPDTKDMLGLVAKGNIIIGDYTSTAFRNQVLPLLSSGTASAVTQAYVVDQTDADLLGYGNTDASSCNGETPCFDGNYDQVDKQGLVPGEKMDHSERKFYESTLSDSDFKKLIDASDDLNNKNGSTAVIDAVLFTNHALAGWGNSDSLRIDGSMVSRDDAIRFRRRLNIYHDIRLLGSETAQQVVLPFTVKRPTLVTWREVPR